MENRSYAQIRWQHERLGLIMVNANREKFFVYAEKLDQMLAHGDEFVVIKERDRRPGRAIGYYPGMVMGAIDLQESAYCIRLFIGEPYRDIGYNEDTGELMQFMTTMEFVLPSDELTKYQEVMATMREQQAIFNARLEEAEATPRVHFVRLKKTSQA